MNLEELKFYNPQLNIREVDDRSFREYGEIISGYDFSEMIDYMEHGTTIPKDNNMYKATVTQLELCAVYERLRNEFYGEMPIQAGYCNGPNSTLNGLEYHKGSEIDIAVTDLILLVGRLQDVNDGKYNSKDVKAFFVPKGTAVQLYETTLHFAPCKIRPEGFKCIVILPRGTNEPLENDRTTYDDKLLFARNKWLLAHPERKPLIDKGACPGIIGENILIKI